MMREEAIGSSINNEEVTNRQGLNKSQKASTHKGNALEGFSVTQNNETLKRDNDQHFLESVMLPVIQECKTKNVMRWYGYF